MKGADLERALFHWRAVIKAQEAGTWQHSFAVSIQRKARGPRWRPSAKEWAHMRDMVAELFQQEATGEAVLIEATA